jgi:hypothetical protein
MRGAFAAQWDAACCLPAAGVSGRCELTITEITCVLALLRARRAAARAYGLSLLTASCLQQRGWRGVPD